MLCTTWSSLPTQYVEHNSLLGGDTDRHVVRKISRFLDYDDGWTITAENVDSSDTHLQSVIIEDGDLYFHTGTVTNRTIEEISLTATKGTDSITDIMLIVIDPPAGSGPPGPQSTDTRPRTLLIPGAEGQQSTVPGPDGADSTIPGAEGQQSTGSAWL